MRASVLILLLSVAAGAAQAERLYRWVDESGRVHYSDQPPPPKIRAVERKQIFVGPASDGDLPYALQEAVKRFPITLYTAAECGDACEKASAYLNKRGAPYTEKDVRDQATGAALMKVTGGKLEVPVATVGPTVLRGYEENAWKTALDAAGYPSSRVVPAAAAGASKKKPSAAETAPADGATAQAQ